jgi:hypothetical protein
MNKFKILLLAAMFAGVSIVVVGMQFTAHHSPEVLRHRDEIQRWHNFVRAADYAEVEKGFSHPSGSGERIYEAVDGKDLYNLKRNGYYTKKRGENDNRYYMTLKVLKKHGVDIGMPFSEFGDPELDAPYNK